VFTLTIVAALVAAGASALNAFSSIGSVNVWKRFKPETTDGSLLAVSRISMVLLVAVGMFVARLPNVQITYLLLLIGAFRGALMLPTIFALFWPKLHGPSAFIGILVGMAVGVPMFIAGNYFEIQEIASLGALAPIAITFLFCVVGTLLASPAPFNYRTLTGVSSRIAES